MSRSENAHRHKSSHQPTKPQTIRGTNFPGQIQKDPNTYSETPHVTFKTPNLNNEQHHKLSKSKEIEQEEANLEARATELKQNMETLNKKKWIQFMRKQEDTLRQKAQQELELYTKQLQNELEAKMISMNQEKAQKIQECQMFYSDLQQKILALQEMCVEMQQKSVELDETYKKCIQELQMDLNTAIIKQKQLMEFQITHQMQQLMKQAITEL